MILILLLCLTQHQTPIKAATYGTRQQEGHDIIESLYYVGGRRGAHSQLGFNAYSETEEIGHLSYFSGLAGPVHACTIYHTIDWTRTRYKYPP